MDEEKTATADSYKRSGQYQASSSKGEHDNSLDPEISSPISEESRRSRDDVENQNEIEPQTSNATSIWASETMSLPQEVLFVATVCLTQFCNRKPDH